MGRVTSTIRSDAVAALAIAALAFHPAPSSAALSPGLARAAAEDPERRVAVWVVFTDRAGADRSPAALEIARERLSPRALDRRARRGAIHDVVASDLPVHEAYLRAVLAHGARLRGVSRWLNAASVEIPARLAPALARLPFVSRVSFVPAARRSPPVVEPAAPMDDADGGHGARPEARAGGGSVTLDPGDPAYYGSALRQLDMMQVPALHAQGLSGAGVLVCMLDSGFHLTHQVFATLDVLATRDFIHGDTNVDDEAGQDSPGQSDHGTWTLGCVAGLKPGTYAGGAFAATVGLAKTEDIASETPVEMDYWQFAAEWADSLGADIISSSLGYTEFDNAADSYTYADMDGRTTVVTLAAVEATRRGITVVNSAGNTGSADWFYVVAPADADSMVAVGAVDSFNVVTTFSAHGPTSDGRIKPDVTAMGRRVLLPNTTLDDGYVRQSGTSFSAPLVASLAALLLEAHPTWRPVDVRDALRATALNHATPDNVIGWGLVQGLGALAWVTTGVPPPAPPAPRLELEIGPNPLVAGASGTIRFAAPGPYAVTLELIDLAGRRRATLFAGPAATPRTLSWRAAADDGTPLATSVYWLRMSAHSASTPVASKSIRLAVIR